jgi:bromodomain-containing factor 1
MNGALTNGHPLSDAIIDMKIDMDIQEPESDARHEPAPNKIDILEDASTAPQVGTPSDPGPSFLLT